MRNRKLAAILATALFALAIGGATAALADVASSITIRWDGEQELFRGRVGADDPECTVHRTVRVFKRTADGRALVGKTSTNNNGRWRLDAMIHGGHFFAVTPAETVMTTDCARAHSKTVDVM